VAIQADTQAGVHALRACTTAARRSGPHQGSRNEKRKFLWADWPGVGHQKQRIAKTVVRRRHSAGVKGCPLLRDRREKIVVGPVQCWEALEELEAAAHADCWALVRDRGLRALNSGSFERPPFATWSARLGEFATFEPTISSPGLRIQHRLDQADRRARVWNDQVVRSLAWIDLALRAVVARCRRNLACAGCRFSGGALTRTGKALIGGCRCAGQIRCRRRLRSSRGSGSW